MESDEKKLIIHKDFEEKLNELNESTLKKTFKALESIQAHGLSTAKLLPLKREKEIAIFVYQIDTETSLVIGSTGSHYIVYDYLDTSGLIDKST